MEASIRQKRNMRDGASKHSNNASTLEGGQEIQQMDNSIIQGKSIGRKSIHSQKQPALQFNKPVILAPAESERGVTKLEAVDFENAMKASNNQTFNESPSEGQSSKKHIKPVPILITDKSVSEKPEKQDKNVFSPIPSQAPEEVDIPHFKQSSRKSKKDEPERESRKSREQMSSRSKSRKKDAKRQHRTEKKEKLDPVQEKPVDEGRFSLFPHDADKDGPQMSKQ